MLVPNQYMIAYAKMNDMTRLELIKKFSAVSNEKQELSRLIFSNWKVPTLAYKLGKKGYL
jgi:hypothetical protein